MYSVSIEHFQCLSQGHTLIYPLEKCTALSEQAQGSQSKTPDPVNLAVRIWSSYFYYWLNVSNLLNFFRQPALLAHMRVMC